MFLLEKVTSEILLNILSLFLKCFNNFLDDMIFLINTDDMFTLYDSDIEKLYLPPPSWKLLPNRVSNYDQSFKANPILCCHEDTICFNCMKIFICFVNLGEDRVVRRTFDHLEYD